ncbi:MAG: hypothetical protein K5981_05805 [Clostridia bacterium]|nr:hypothetical protein [Clostridia bacterium]
MKTDVIRISAGGDGMPAALEQTEKAAAWRGLDPKQTLRLRLLAEEMMGMLRTIVGGGEFYYWVETEGGDFSLHLSADTQVNSDMRRELLKASTSGKNAAATGFMGKLRDIFTHMYEPDANGMSPVGYGFYTMEGGMSINPVSEGLMYGWSLNAYRDAIATNAQKDAEEWDELEKSITAKLADEIKIYIRENNVEMVVEKTF